jgi:hypothetical protein
VSNYRLSYWKTTCFAAAAVILCFSAVVLLWVAKKYIALLGIGWLAEVALLAYWPACFLSIALALYFLAIGLGGMICLYKDARGDKGNTLSGPTDAERNK